MFKIERDGHVNKDSNYMNHDVKERHKTLFTANSWDFITSHFHWDDNIGAVIEFGKP